MFGIPPEVLMGLVTGVLGFFARSSAQRQADMVDLAKQNRENVTQENSNQNDASARSSSMLRKIIAISVVCGALLIISVVSFFPDITTTLIQEVPQRSFLFFKWGSAYELITTSGLILPTWIKYVVISITGFLFGSSAGRVKR